MSGKAAKFLRRAAKAHTINAPDKVYEENLQKRPYMEAKTKKVTRMVTATGLRVSRESTRGLYQAMKQEFKNRSRKGE